MWNLLKSTYCYQSNHIFLNKRKLVNELKKSQMALTGATVWPTILKELMGFVFQNYPLRENLPKTGVDGLFWPKNSSMLLHKMNAYTKFEIKSVNKICMCINKLSCVEAARQYWNFLKVRWSFANYASNLYPVKIGDSQHVPSAFSMLSLFYTTGFPTYYFFCNLIQRFLKVVV